MRRPEQSRRNGGGHRHTRKHLCLSAHGASARRWCIPRLLPRRVLLLHAQHTPPPQELTFFPIFFYRGAVRFWAWQRIVQYSGNVSTDSTTEKMFPPSNITKSQETSQEENSAHAGWRSHACAAAGKILLEQLTAARPHPRESKGADAYSLSLRSTPPAVYERRPALPHGQQPVTLHLSLSQTTDAL